MDNDENEVSDQRATAEKLLQGAYKLKTADDNVDYYRAFAEIYDRQFATALSYTYPQAVAEEFLKYSGGGDFPVLDVGCGTGLVAAALSKNLPVDGVDISTEMIEVAEKKSLYRQIFHLDLTLGCTALPNDYGGVISAGTFTHGHLGPAVLAALLGVGRAGSLFCIGVNLQHYESKGFRQTLEQLHSAAAIKTINEIIHPIFGNNSDGHGQDKALVLLFRKN